MSEATSSYDYALPEDRIAQTPLAERDASRLLHVPPGDAPPEDRGFRELPALLRGGDLLVVNDTRVRAARLRTTTEHGGAVELLVLQNLGDGRYSCLVRPGRRLREGRTLDVGEGLCATIEGNGEGHDGARIVRFESDDVDAAIERLGSVPLPPYIHTALPDPNRYQTMFAAATPESAAAPTAGLHFTPRVLDDITGRGIDIATVRLEVGLGTFAPIRSASVADHAMHEERYELPQETAAAIARTRQRKGRVIAVGTTAVRTLETRADPQRPGEVVPGSGSTRLFLRPGIPFTVTDGLLTNLHAPRSSLVVLVAAFVGSERWRSAYEHALANGYRFLSFGDCMLCWRAER